MNKKSTTNSNNTLSPIFIHSLWRAGSTYLYSVFRRSAFNYWCYQEPLHEIALSCKNNPEKLLDYIGDRLLPLRHPKLDKSYYFELHEVAPHWTDTINKPIIYEQYFDNVCSEDLKNYFHALISNSRGRTVIQECRTSNRIQALKSTFSGVHIYLWRNPWDQWWSYKATQYFDNTSQLILNSAAHPTPITKIRQEIGFREFHDSDIYRELEYFDKHRLTPHNSYLVFYLLWCLALLEASSHADLLINIDSLSNSLQYKNETYESLLTLGINEIDLTDCAVPQGHYSQQEISFFQQLEDRVHGLLLCSNIPQHRISFLTDCRKTHEPKTISTQFADQHHVTLAAEAQRARDIVIRQEDRYAAQLQSASKQHEENRYKILSLQNDLTRQKEDTRARESVLTQQIRIKEQELLSSVQTLAEREKEFAQQIIANRESAEDDKRELLNTLLSNEKALRTEFSHRESQIRMELSDALTKLSEREREFSLQLISLRTIAENEKNTLVQQQLAQEKALLSKINQYESIITYEQNERVLAVQKLNEFKLSSAHAETQLRQQLDAEQKTVHNLQLSLHALNSEIGRIRSSMSWMLTAPLRALRRLFYSPCSNSSHDTTSVPDWYYPEHTSEISKTALTNCMLSEVQHMLSESFEQPPKTAESVNELLSYFDKSFINCSYMTLLGRAPDTEGMSYYLQRLRSGVSKVEILAQLRLSREGKNNKRHVSGLDSLLRRHRLLKMPLVGTLARLMGVTPTDTVEHRMSAIENQLYLLKHSRPDTTQLIKQIIKQNEYTNSNLSQVMLTVSGIHSILASKSPPITANVQETPELSLDTTVTQTIEAATPLISRTIELSSENAYDAIKELATFVNQSNEARLLYRK